MCDNSSEFDKHMSEQIVPRTPQGGVLYNQVSTESYNEREARMLQARPKSMWEKNIAYDDQTGPGAATWIPGTFCDGEDL